VWKAHYLNRFFIQTHSLITQKNNRNEWKKKITKECAIVWARN
jgi:hypothetical protein